MNLASSQVKYEVKMFQKLLVDTEESQSWNFRKPRLTGVKMKTFWSKFVTEFVTVQTFGIITRLQICCLHWSAFEIIKQTKCQCAVLLLLCTQLIIRGWTKEATDQTEDSVP